MSEPVLSVRNLSVRYNGKESTVYAADSVSFDLFPGKVMALVGESGAGKSTVALSILKLLPQQAEILGGQVLFEGRDLAKVEEGELRSIRGRRISMVFQDPVAGLNPVIPVGDQVAEILTSHLTINKREARARAGAILREVGLADPERVARSYPFQLSGGMCQRVMIGIATALNPQVLVADEPTSALDVTIQAQILLQMDRLRETRGTAILLITHSLGVVAQIADEVGVMYGGRLVEMGKTRAILSEPLHPYSDALLATLPRLDSPGGALHAIPGQPPEMSEPADHCPFIPRCIKALSECRNSVAPPLLAGGAEHYVACYNPVWRG